MRKISLLLIAVLFLFGCSKKDNEVTPSTSANFTGLSADNTAPLGEATLLTAVTDANASSYKWYLNDSLIGVGPTAILYPNRLGKHEIKLEKYIPTGRITNLVSIDATLPKGVIVVNQGTFSGANGSVTFYHNSSGGIFQDIYRQANGTSLGGNTVGTVREGGFFYSMTTEADKGYLVVAGTGTDTRKLEVVSLNTFRSLSIIRGFDVPRFAAVIGNKCYVTDWGAYDANYNSPTPCVKVVNLTTNTIVQTIVLGENERPEGIIAANGKIYVAINGNKYVSGAEGKKVIVINTTTNQIETNINTPDYPNAFTLDANGKIWVSCATDTIIRINPNTDVIEAKIGFGGVTLSGAIVSNTAKNKLYVLSTDGGFSPEKCAVYEVDITASVAGGTPLITADNIESIGFDTHTNTLLLADRANYSSAGKVLRYNTSGTKISEFGTGITPRGFAIK
jgi:hypothetical protein